MKLTKQGYSKRDSRLSGSIQRMVAGPASFCPRIWNFLVVSVLALWLIFSKRLWGSSRKSARIFSSSFQPMSSTTYFK